MWGRSLMYSGWSLEATLIRRACLDIINFTATWAPACDGYLNARWQRTCPNAVTPDCTVGVETAQSYGPDRAPGFVSEDIAGVT